MGIIKSDEADAPSEPHLGILTAKGMIPLKVGSVMAIVEDPQRVDGVYLLVLKKVDHRYIEFDALSSDKSSTRRVKFVAEWKGDFKSWWRSAQKPKTTDEVGEGYDPAMYVGTDIKEE